MIYIYESVKSLLDHSRGYPINMYKYLKGEAKKTVRFFSVVAGARTGVNGHKLKYRRFSLIIRKHLLCM